MILNISHNKQDVREEINEKVGKAFSIFKRIRLGGNRSQNFVISEASNKLRNFIHIDNETNLCNIELRAHGILLYFRPKTEAYVWVVPYYLLNIFKNDTHISLFAEGEFVRLMPEHNAALNIRFLQKLQEQKSKQHQMVDDYTNENGYTQSH